MHHLRRAALVTGLATLATLASAIPAQAVAGEHYVALGDSYSSGLGSGDYTAESGNCQRSYRAYPALWAEASAPASYTSAACAGATTADVLNTQVAALSATTTLVSITIGGNDVGFADVMTTCVLGGTAACVAAVQAAEDSANATLAPKLGAVYDAITARAPRAKVIVLSYPVFYQLGVPLCIGLSETSRAKIDEGINLVDELIATVVRRHGLVFADARPAFVGHQLCSGFAWLHALDIVTINESYHPTAAGQAGGYLPTLKTAAG